MKWPNMPQWLSVAMTTFVGGAVGELQAEVATSGLPQDGAHWKAIALGALVAGLAAWMHLYQAKPGAAPEGGAS